jgi:carboxypeptidase Q
MPSRSVPLPPVRRRRPSLLPAVFLLIAPVFVPGITPMLAPWIAPAAALAAQTFPGDDPVLERIWEEGMDNSHIYQLGQTLMDVIGPRLTGSPQLDQAHDWIVETYGEWGIQAENQQYGTWMAWDHGVTHLDLLQPRRTSLVARPLAWTGGTEGPVEGPVVTLPDVRTQDEFRSWLETDVPGALVLLSFPQPTCRPDPYWERHAAPESREAMERDREERRENWMARMQAAGIPPQQIAPLLQQAGAVAVLTNNWAGSWGTSRVFSGSTGSVPSLEVECEDYSLLARLAEEGQAPRARVNMEASFQGETPTFNTVGTIRGSELPDEYVVLSAHLDTWHGGTGATDNGTGTITMMETMRILRTVFPNPRRTIVVGHWGGEEQGLNGSAAFAEDNPEILEGMQILLNQDNGTGRITDLGMQGFIGAGPFFGRWLARVPEELTRNIELELPGLPDEGRSDHASFVCHGAPAFRLGSHEFDYRDYTWHTNRDTFDKIAIEEVKWNAVLTAMLAYLASEDADRVPRDRRVLPADPRTEEPMEWPACRSPVRSW